MESSTKGLEIMTFFCVEIENQSEFRVQNGLLDTSTLGALKPEIIHCHNSRLT